MKQKICINCRGHGIVKMTPIPCIQCGGQGKFCMHCENKSGFSVRPFEECDKCMGIGYIKEKSNDKPNKNKYNVDNKDEDNKCILI